MDILKAADYFFSIFHTALIVFNLAGWAVKSWRKVHFAVLSLTFASWFLLGIWYGIGYCPLTDWHWQILRELGETGLPSSYIAYLLDRFLGLQFPSVVVDFLTVGTALAAWLISGYLNFYPRLKRALKKNRER